MHCLQVHLAHLQDHLQVHLPIHRQSIYQNYPYQMQLILVMRNHLYLDLLIHVLSHVLVIDNHPDSKHRTLYLLLLSSIRVPPLLSDYHDIDRYYYHGCNHGYYFHQTYH